jgi:hypothetical protein
MERKGCDLTSEEQKARVKKYNDSRRKGLFFLDKWNISNVKFALFKEWNLSDYLLVVRITQETEKFWTCSSK